MLLFSWLSHVAYRIGCRHLRGGNHRVVYFGNEFITSLKMDRRWEMDLYRGDAGYIDLLPQI
jgi:RNase adaptor protein for sRNA GlmZ degradation